MRPTVVLYAGRDTLDWEHDRARTTLALALAGLARPGEAEQEFRRALELGEQFFGATPTIVPRRESLLRTLDAYAGFLRAQTRPDDAREFEERAGVIRAVASGSGN